MTSRNLTAKRSYKIVFVLFSLLAGMFFACEKKDTKEGPNVNNSLTLFKLDNKNNNQDLISTDTVLSLSGVQGKYIPVSGATGAASGLGTVKIVLLTLKDSLLTTLEITSFFKTDYHLFNAQLNIPVSQKGKIYKVLVTVVDQGGNEVGKKSFIGQDVVTCDPLPPCLVTNQITVLVETPGNTPSTDELYIFGGFNGWNRGDAAFKMHKNPDVANCYCITLPFAPGFSGWQLSELFVSRGTYDTDATTIPANNPFISNYTTTDLGPLWKVKVPRWRDK